MYRADGWTDYEIIDTGDGEKLERWGDVILRRPDPQVIWPKAEPNLWAAAHGHYRRSATGGGAWDFAKKLPDRWQIAYNGLRFHIRPTNFKHTGVFPEQAANWDWMTGIIRRAGGPCRVLNLFAYTGGATLACAASGAAVCHVDAAKGMVAWAKDNLRLSGLESAPCRFIVEDALSFAEREIRRGNHYEGIIMDPPSYGRGPDGQVWKLEERLYALVSRAELLLSDRPLFFLINGYTTGFAAGVLKNMLCKAVVSRRGGEAEADELGLPVTEGGLTLPCGSSGRWAAR